MEERKTYNAPDPYCPDCFGSGKLHFHFGSPDHVYFDVPCHCIVTRYLPPNKEDTHVQVKG